MSRIKELEVTIEKLRTEMHEAYQKDAKSKEVLVVSEKLDAVLNEYMKLIHRLNQF